jgi:hypothetical protein
MSLALTISSMTAAGCNAEQINAVVQAHEAEREQIAAEKRAKKTAQKRKERERMSPYVAATDNDIVRQEATGGDNPPPKEIPPIPPKEITPPSRELRSLESSRARAAFVEFKKIYPKRSGAQPWTPAEKKFLTVCREGISPDEILAGAAAYARSEAADDPKFVAQAITWLNQKRWADDYPPRLARDGPNGHGRTNGTTAFVMSVLEDIENDKRRREESDLENVPMLQRNG